MVNTARDKITSAKTGSSGKELMGTKRKYTSEDEAKVKENFLKQANFVDVTDEYAYKKQKVEEKEPTSFKFPKDTLKTVKQCDEFMKLMMNYHELAKNLKFDILLKQSGGNNSTDVVMSEKSAPKLTRNRSFGL